MPRLGIISEGRPDQSVIENILTPFISDEFEIILLRPDLSVDSTDVKLRNNAAAGGLSRIKKDCKEGILLEEFFVLDISGKDMIILQLDTAEIEEYGIHRPDKKSEDYVQKLRNSIIELIQTNWLDKIYHDKIIYAICIEEMEAWILTIYEKKNSIKFMDPKSRLKNKLKKKNLSSKESYDNYFLISKKFKKKKNIEIMQKYNESLLLFISDINSFLDTLKESA